MTTTHTPGPWHTDTLLVKDARNEVICHCTRWEGRTPMPEVAVENARLIAAAPELLSVVKKLREVVEALGMDPVDSGYWSICEQADLAIANAEGRAQGEGE